MEVRRTTDNASQTPPAASPLTIGSGGQGTILFDPEAMVVHKQFHELDGHDAGYLANAEFAYLTRFGNVLSDEPYLSCPKPLGVDAAQGTITMSHCPGERLDDYLSAPDADASMNLEHIADQISRATQLYIREFDEPYFDLGPHNMLYDEDSCRICFIDFMTMGDVRRFFKEGQTPEDFSLGNFIGTSVYHTVRPSTWNNEMYWRRVKQVAIGVATRLQQQYVLSPHAVQSTSRKVYGVWALYGKPIRLVWYSTLAQALFRRRVSEVISHIGE